MLAKYEDSFNIPLKSAVHFKEYILDRHENKKLRNQTDGILSAIIKPEDSLSCDEIATYYQNVPQQFHINLSRDAFVRLVLDVGQDRQGMPIYRVVSLNKYYMMVGLQELEYEQAQETMPELPNQILGFNSYNFGEKFKD